MKIKIFIVLVLGILFNCNICFSHSNDSIIKYIDSLNKVDTFRIVVNDTLIELKSGVRTVKINTSDLNNCECLSTTQWILVFTPIILILFFLGFFLVISIKVGFKDVAIKIFRPLFILRNSSDQSEKISFNRLIAFMAASISCIVITMILTLYIYNILGNCKIPLSFDGLNTLLVTLGIGIAIPVSLEKGSS